MPAARLGVVADKGPSSAPPPVVNDPVKALDKALGIAYKPCYRKPSLVCPSSSVGRAGD